MSVLYKNVFRNKGRSVYTILGVAIAISVVVAIGSATNGLKTNLISLLSNFRGDVLVMEADAFGVSNSRLPSELAQTISVIEGVEKAEPYAMKHVFVGFTNLSERGIRRLVARFGSHELEQQLTEIKLKTPRVPLAILGIDVDSGVFDKYELLEGEKRFTSDYANEIILGATLIKLLRRALDKFYSSENAPGKLKRFLKRHLKGDKLGLPKLYIAGREFTIRGAIKTGTLQDSQAIIPLGTFQTLFDAEGFVHAFMVSVDKGTDRQMVADRIRTIDTTRPLWADAPERLLDEFSDQIEDVRKLVWATTLLAIIIGAISVLNSMASNVFERTNEIGLLKAVGWSKWMITKMVVLESLILAVLGGILAFGLSILEIELVTWIVGQDPVPQGYKFEYFIRGLLIATAVGAIGSIIPAWRAARLKPVDALRHA